MGYPRYAAHGSDLGAGVTAWLARTHPDAVAGIHLATPGLPAPPAPWTPAEQAYFAEAESWTAEEGGYAHQQATKPSTLGAGLHDSPAGLAAWIGEKIIAWSSTTSHGRIAFNRDLLLGTLTLYWATGTITSSMQPYWAYRHIPGSALPAGQPSAVPTALLHHHQMARTRPRRALPRRCRAAAAGTDPPRRPPASSRQQLMHSGED